jgi:Na+/H+-dicarboxylate symporter
MTKVLKPMFKGWVFGALIGACLSLFQSYQHQSYSLDAFVNILLFFAAIGTFIGLALGIHSSDK